MEVRPRIAVVDDLPEDRERLLAEGLADAIQERLRALGFAYVTADLGGYRMGSMNATIRKDSLQETAEAADGRNA